MKKDSMRIVFFAYSRQGIRTAFKAVRCFPDAVKEMCVPERLYDPRLAEKDPDIKVLPIPVESRSFYEEMFSNAALMIFVGAVGIAVRMIAPFVKDKQTDPAVICLDEKASFVIPVLSGHIGGANKMAAYLAEQLKAVPVITTATDINHRFSVDAWTASHGLILDDIKVAKAVSAAILEGEVPLISDLPVATPYPLGVVPVKETDNEPHLKGPGILISWKRKEPFERTLRLIPVCIYLGIGCRKGIACKAIEAAVNKVLEENAIDSRSIAGVVSIDLKQEEEGLKEFCRERGLPFTVYSAQELQAVEGNFASSAFVRHVTGVDNVCERAARKAADVLLVHKTAWEGVTVAAAVKMIEIRFD